MAEKIINVRNPQKTFFCFSWRKLINKEKKIFQKTFRNNLFFCFSRAVLINKEWPEKVFYESGCNDGGGIRGDAIPTKESKGKHEENQDLGPPENGKTKVFKSLWKPP